MLGGFLLVAVAIAIGILVWVWKERTAAMSELRTVAERLDAREREIASLSSQLEHVRSQLAHDLRSPLNSILGFSELLSGDRAGQLCEKQRQFVDNIRTSARQIVGIIDTSSSAGHREGSR